MVTGYHLTDPSGSADACYAAQLDALVPRADAVVTLTASAADEMRHALGRRPDRAAAPARGRLRPHAPAAAHPAHRAPRRLAPGDAGDAGDPVRLVDGLARAVRAMDNVRLSVHVHETVLDAGSSTYDLATVREIDRLVRAAGGALRVHRPFSESQLWDHLFGLDVSVVPGLFGSHSVWPEACADLGTVAAASQRHPRERQQPCLTYDDARVRRRPGRLLRQGACGRRGSRTRVWRADPEARWAERVRVAESLRALYERLLGLDRR